MKPHTIILTTTALALSALAPSTPAADLARPSPAATAASEKLKAAALPVIIRQPVNATVAEGGATRFTLATAATPPVAKYQWQYLANPTTWRDLADGKTYAGATTPTLAITNPLREINGYQYRCAVSNPVGTIYTNTVTLTVTIPPPVITLQPVSQTITAGSGALLVIAATASFPPSYQWQISTNNGIAYTDLADTPPTATPAYAHTATSRLSIINAPAALNGALYRCTVKNTTATLYSAPAKLTIK